MNWLDILLIGIGLSMDAFAVSLCKGIGLKKMNWKGALLAGLYFGGFQALMPSIGYFAAAKFYEAIERYDHWIAFGLLLVIGLNMIHTDECRMEPLSLKERSFRRYSKIPLLLPYLSSFRYIFSAL